MRGGTKPSFYRPFSHPAFVSVCRADGTGRQSFLLLVVQSFLSTFQRTAKVNLYQGVSPSFPVFPFEEGAYSTRLCACGHQSAMSKAGTQAGSTMSVIGFQLAIAQRVFCVCALGSDPLLNCVQICSGVFLSVDKKSVHDTGLRVTVHVQHG